MVIRRRIFRLTAGGVLTLTVSFPPGFGAGQHAGPALYAVVGPMPAEAHVVGLSYADVVLEGRTARMSLRVPARALAEHLKLPLDLATATGSDVVRVGAGQIAAFFQGKVEIINADQACRPSLPEVQPDADPDRIRVRFAFVCGEALGEVGIYLYFFNEFGPEHSTLASIRRGATVKEFVFTQERTDFHFPLREGEGPGLLAQAGSFVLLGIEHLFTGYDHILFLLGLLLIWRGLLNIVKIVTSFTLAHSITLFAAALEFVTLPSRLVEAVIALSIAYVGIENLFAERIERRWRVAFLFGLMHGFGFAGILREMGLPSRGLLLSLFSFNVGVEVGQLAIVAAFFPLIYFAHRRSSWPHLVRGLSIAVFAMGMVWFVQRTFLASA